MGTEENVAASVNNECDDLETMSNEETQSQCKALAKTTGKQCKNTASPGSEHCSVHQQTAGRRAEQANTAPTLKIGKTRTTVGDAYEISPEEFEAIAARPKVIRAETAFEIHAETPIELHTEIRDTSVEEAMAFLEALDDKREVAEETAPTPPEEQVEVEEGPQQTSSKRKKGGAWEEHHCFYVSFDYKLNEESEPVVDKQGERVWQTRLYDTKSGDEPPFEGLDTAPWVNEILKRAKLPVAAKPIPIEIEAAAPPTPSTPYDARIEILDVQVSEPPTRPGVREKKLMAEVRFQVSGSEAKKLTTERIPFQIEVHTVDLESGALHLVASERSQLQPGESEYTSQQKLSIPDLGRYELESIVLLLPPGEIMASRYRGAPFKVVS